MSTKIAPAFRLTGTDGAALLALVAPLRAQIRQLAKDEHAALIAKRVCDLIDRAIIYRRDWPHNAISLVATEIDEHIREIDERRIRHPEEDFGMEVALIPDAATNATYGILYCERYAWRQLWMQVTGASPWSWWDGTDAPDDITPEEWETRKQTWQRIMPSGVPGEHGYTLRLAPTGVLLPHKDPMPFQPKLEGRKYTIARQKVIDELVGSDAAAAPDYIARVSRAIFRLDEPESQRRIAQVAAELRLPPLIDLPLARSTSRPDDLILA